MTQEIESEAEMQQTPRGFGRAAASGACGRHARGAPTPAEDRARPFGNSTFPRIGSLHDDDHENLLDSITPDGTADLKTVLAAWNTATVRLQQTHEALRSEVRRLTDELEVKNRELARKNRLADLGQMASHIAHEVRNNLVPVTLYLSLLRRRLSDDSGSVDMLDKVGAGFIALDATVNDLLNFTSDRDPQFRSVLLDRKLVDDVLGTLAPQLSAQGIDLDRRRAGRSLSVVGRLRHAAPRRAQPGAQRHRRHARRRRAERHRLRRPHGCRDRS